MKILDRLSELEGAATQGPWDYYVFYGVALIKSKDNDAIAHAVDYLENDNAQLIAESRNALPELIAVARAAKKLEYCGPDPLDTELCDALAKLESLCAEK